MLQYIVCFLFVVIYRNFCHFSTYFPAFGLNTERYGVSLGIQSECWKIRMRITPNTDIFTQHCIKYRSFTQFSGVEILRKGTISAQFRVIRPKLCGNCAFPQNCHTRELGEITVFFAVIIFPFETLSTLVHLSTLSTLEATTRRYSGKKDFH